MLQDRYKNKKVYLNRPILNPVEKNSRNILRFFPHYNVNRMDGVSAIVLLRDEPLAFDSIISILPFVDEVIVVDSSSISYDLPISNKIVYVHAPPEQDMQFKIGMLLSHFRWLLRWDGDFLSVPETKEFLDTIRSIKDGYWQVKTMVVNVNDNKVDYLQKEQYAFTFHPEILTANYKPLKHFSDIVSKIRGGLPGRICYGMLPYFFGQIDIDMVFAEHHYKCKSKQRLLEREHQAQWSMLSDKERSGFGSFENYIKIKTEG